MGERNSNLKSRNYWKYLSVALMAMLGLGVMTLPAATAQRPPDAGGGPHAAVLAAISDAVTTLQGSLAGIQANTNLIPSLDSKLDSIQDDVGSIGTDNLDVPVSSRANQTSVDSLQSTADAIKAKTDTLPASFASSEDIATAQNAVNEIVNTRASQESVDELLQQLEVLKCNSPIRTYVDLSGCNLSGANLAGANLEDASLVGADLEDANLEGANLRSADLRGANLRIADLEGANLFVASLRNANLVGANLEGASLRSANLEGASLRSANLEGASLIGADFTDCVGDPVGTPAAGTLPDCD